MWLNSSSAGSRNTIFKIQKVVKNHNHITFFFFFFFGLLMSFPDDCGYSLKFDTGTFSSLFLEYYLFIWLSRVFVGACRIFCCGAQTRQLWCMGCFFTACGIRNQGSNPMSPASQSRFVTSGPPGKSDSHIIFVTKIEIKHAIFSGRFSRRAVFP